LVVYWTEAVSFFDYLIETGLTPIMQLLKPESQANLLQTNMKRLLSTPEGHSLARDLASALIGHTFKLNESVAYVTDILSQRFGSFCSGNDVIFYDAAKNIYSARNAPNTSQAKAILTQSLNTLVRIALHIPVEYATEVADQFAAQGYHGYGIRFAVACAHARDPQNVTTACVEAGMPANDPRIQVYKAKKPFYDIAFKLVHDVVTKFINAASNDSHVKDVMREAFSYDDRAYQYYMYEKFMEKKLGQELIKVKENSPISDIGLC
jgi:nuclear pore complex protein Nup155